MKMPTLISLSLVALIIAVFCGIISYFIYKDNVSVSGWPTTTGTVMVSNKKAIINNDVSTSHNRAVLWHPVIEYTYKVSGIPYIGKEISHRSYDEIINNPPGGVYENSKPSKSFMALLDKYSVGTNLTVHYNPLNPKESLLEIDNFGTKLFGGIAIIGLLMSVVFLSYYFYLEKIKMLL